MDEKPYARRPQASKTRAEHPRRLAVRPTSYEELCRFMNFAVGFPTPQSIRSTFSVYIERLSQILMPQCICSGCKIGFMPRKTDREVSADADRYRSQAFGAGAWFFRPGFANARRNASSRVFFCLGGFGNLRPSD